MMRPHRALAALLTAGFALTAAPTAFADPAAPLSGILNFLPDEILHDVLNCASALCGSVIDSQYDTVIITNEYDGFADFPDNPLNILAVANAVVGLLYRHGQTVDVDVREISAGDVTTTVSSLGGVTTTYLARSPFLPLTQPLRDAGMAPELVDELDSVLRPIVDSAYKRNTPTVRPATSTVPATEAPGLPAAAVQERVVVPAASVTASVTPTAQVDRGVVDSPRPGGGPRSRSSLGPRRSSGPTAPRA